MAEEDRARLQTALERLQEALAGLVTLAESRMGDRCPSRAADDRCTFEGGCENQRREAGAGGNAPVIRCGGDHRLRWTGEPRSDARPHAPDGEDGDR
jgi:hypothetical protein